MGDHGTPKATRKYVTDRLEHVPSVLGSTELVVSPFGFGGYRVAPDFEDHKKALKLAIAKGINLIDTSTNYTDGGSETLVGEVLAEMFGAGAVNREDLVVVTKAGYLQGQNLQQAMLRRDQGRPYPEVTVVNDNCWHCFNPEFLDEQLTASLTRLRLQTVDVLLLHNPEYFFDKSDDQDEFYRRIKAAFAFLESAVQDGRIKAYGISSNTFGTDDKDPKFVSLERVWQIAEEISASHHFKVIQLPFNLLEPVGLTIRNNQKIAALLYAEKKRLGTLINRPFNGFYQGKMIRLAEYQVHRAVPDRDQITQVLQDAIKLEQTYPPGDFMALGELPVGAVLAQNFNQIPDLMTWQELLDYQILPSLEAVATKAAAEPAWLQDYQDKTAALFQVFTDYFRAVQNGNVAPVKDVLEEKFSELTKGPLSQQALQIYLSIPQIHCTLIGMRREEYVNDVLATTTDKIKGTLQQPLLAFLHDLTV